MKPPMPLRLSSHRYTRLSSNTEVRKHSIATAVTANSALRGTPEAESLEKAFGA